MRTLPRIALVLAAAATVFVTVLAGPRLLAAQDASGEAEPAQEAERVAFRHLTTADKLSNESVETLFQDRFGFIWIGTADGLDRYDGYDVKPYERTADSTSLSDNVVSALAEDASGALWVGTRRGLNRLDRESDTFRRYRATPGGLPGDDVVVLHADSSGMLWVGTEGGGLGRYDIAADSWTTYRHEPGDPTSLPNDAVRALASGDDGALWIGTGAGVARLDPASGQFRTYRPGGDASALSGDVSSIALSETGGLWVGTFGDGLFRLDPGTGGFTSIDLGGSAASVVKSVYEDPSGTLWVGTLGDGLRQFPPGTGAPLVYRATEGDPDALINDSVLDIMEDRQGVLWVATYGGVDRFDRARGTVTRFRHDPQAPGSLSSNDVHALLVSTDGALYAGTDGAVDVLTGSGSFRHLSLGSDQVKAYALAQTRDGAIWAGTTSGLYRVDSGGLEAVPVKAPGEVLIANVLLEDRAGRFYIGTLGDGLVRFDRSSGESVTYAHDPASPSSIAHDNVRALAEDARGALWVGTQEGLCRLDGATASGAGASGGQFTCFRAAPDDSDALASGYIHALHIRERDGSLWIGTSDGLHRLDPSAPEAGFSRFTEATSDLPGTAVLAIVEDGDGFLWLATNRGLTKFDPTTSTFQQRTLGGEGSARSLGEAAARGPEGKLYFGGTNGLLAFNPTQLAAANPYPPEVVITDVLLGTNAVEPGPDSPLDAAAPAATTLRLNHSQADWITVAFAGLHFSDPARNSYRYQMEGVHDEWRGGLGDRDRTASYNDLGPGRYTFRVQAANADGEWSPEGASLSIIVSPPWWRTPWAYLAYFALTVVGLIRLDRWQRARLLREERSRAESREQEIRAETAEAEARKAEADRQRAEAEARAARAEAEGKREIEKAFRELKAMQTQLVQSEKLASLGQLTAGIAHEIKNPLNFVNNFADLSVELADELGEELHGNKDKPVSSVLEEVDAILEDLRENSRRIHEHGTRADRIVKAMLLHSRGASGELARVEANRFVEEYANLAYHGARANDKEFQVDLVRELAPEAGEVEVIPQELGRVLINLLSNAFYAVGQRRKLEGESYQPQVTVATDRIEMGESEGVEIRIGDNGTGIPDELREKVFEPFFTTKPTGDGTGLGLSLAHEIIAQGHGGSLSVESAEGVGTTFSIRLPARGLSPAASGAPGPTEP